MVPFVPLLTMAVMVVELVTLKEVAAVPPKLTAVTPVKLVPVMVTVVPDPADVGVKEVMDGTGLVINASEASLVTSVQQSL